jgi:hypothetical protein
LSTGLLVEAAGISSFPDDITLHCSEDLGARGDTGKIQFRVERIKLEDIVMVRAGSGSWTKLTPASACRGALLGSVWDISHRKSFANAFQL